MLHQIVIHCLCNMGHLIQISEIIFGSACQRVGILGDAIFRSLWSVFIYFRRIMFEVFEAVKFMHDSDIVHRDLKVCCISQ